MPSETIRSDFIFPVNVMGWKIYYGDAQIQRDSNGNFLRWIQLPTVVSSLGIDRAEWGVTWEVAPLLNAQVVGIYYDRTYTKRFTERDESGLITIREELRRFHDLAAEWDWFWFDPTTVRFGRATNLQSVPVGALAKQSQELDGNLWHAIYNYAYTDWTF